MIVVLRDRIMAATFLFAVAVSSLAMQGCSVIDRRFGEWFLAGSADKMHASLSGTIPCFQTDGEIITLTLEDMEAATTASCTRGQVEVFYPDGMQHQAEQLAELLNHSREHLEAQLGANIIFKSQLFLMPAQENLKSVKFSGNMESGSMSFPVMFEDGQESIEDILSSNHWSYVHWFTLHEGIEFTLMNPDETIALPDLQYRYTEGLFGLTLLRYTSQFKTRWFRDGFSEYATHLAEKEMAAFARLSWPDATPSTERSARIRPFSLLAEYGPDLLEWNQYDQLDKEKRMYSAAIGLFLLLEHRFGRESIKQILAEIRSIEYPDGQALKEVVNRVTGTDLRQMLDSFYFPNSGMKLKYTKKQQLVIESIQHEGLASCVGLAVGDILESIDGQSASGLLNYEMAVLLASEGHRPLPLKIMRDDKTIEVSLNFVPHIKLPKR